MPVAQSFRKLFRTISLLCSSSPHGKRVGIWLTSENASHISMDWAGDDEMCIDAVGELYPLRKEVNRFLRHKSSNNVDFAYMSWRMSKMYRCTTSSEEQPLLPLCFLPRLIIKLVCIQFGIEKASRTPLRMLESNESHSPVK